MKKIARIDPRTAAKVSFVLFGLISPFFYFIFFIRSIFTDGILFGAPWAVKLICVIIIVVIGPLGLGSCLGLLALLLAWLYNVTCKYTGGLQVELEDL